MTGFAAHAGASGPWRWTAELRSVNGRGLDIRLRVPDWIPGLDHALRAELGKAARRGNLSLSLRVMRSETGGAASLDKERLEAVLDALATVAARARARGTDLDPASTAEVLAFRGVLTEAEADEDELAALAAAIVEDVRETLVPAFIRSREEEGAALQATLTGLLDEIADLVGKARGIATTRRAELEEGFRAALRRIAEAGVEVDEARISQELAVMAVKADVTEELDRLEAHVAAARGLLEADEPVGRRLDFLMQEFNREANTLCSKSQHEALTATGLDLKVAIDRMREQVQNVE